MKTPGIYTIACLQTGAHYVGQSNSIIHRFGVHRWQLRHGTHGNSHLQNAWNKYGGDAFIFSVAIIENSARCRNLLEDALYIALQQQNIPLYNARPTWQTAQSYFHSADSIEK